MPDSQMNFRIDRETKERFKALARQRGKEVSALLNSWITAFLEDESFERESDVASLDSLDKLVESKLDAKRQDVERLIADRVESARASDAAKTQEAVRGLSRRLGRLESLRSEVARLQQKLEQIEQLSSLKPKSSIPLVGR